MNPVTRRRLRAFRANRRAFWSLLAFLTIFAVSMCAELVANDRPLLVRFQGQFYAPVFRTYPETVFGGDFETEADYRDPHIRDLIRADGWMLWPPVPYSHATINYDLPVPAPAPPSARNWLGTDDQGRDVLARIIYGVRLSILFGLILASCGSAIGIAVGACQGYYGGLIDLAGQRFLEIWSGMPALFILIILASLVAPGFWWLLAVTLLF